MLSGGLRVGDISNRGHGTVEVTVHRHDQDLFTAILNDRILWDEHGVWFASDAHQVRALTTYLRILEGTPAAQYRGRPRKAVHTLVQKDAERLDLREALPGCCCCRCAAPAKALTESLHGNRALVDYLLTFDRIHSLHSCCAPKLRTHCNAARLDQRGLRKCQRQFPSGLFETMTLGVEYS